MQRPLPIGDKEARALGTEDGKPWDLNHRDTQRLTAQPNRLRRRPRNRIRSRLNGLGFIVGFDLKTHKTIANKGWCLSLIPLELSSKGKLALHHLEAKGFELSLMKILRFHPSTYPSTLLEGCWFTIVLCLQGLPSVFAFGAIPDFVGFLPSRAVGLRVSYRPCSPKKPPRRSRDKQVQRVHPRTVWIFL